jgi:hypothetical protein
MFCSVVGAHTVHGLLAGLFTAAAGFRTYTAMFVHSGVAFALITAKAARCHACIQYVTNDILVRSGSASRHGSCRHADIGAVHVEANALR